jgi:hypothetical protein
MDAHSGKLEASKAERSNQGSAASHAYLRLQFEDIPDAERPTG